VWKNLIACEETTSVLQGCDDNMIFLSFGDFSHLMFKKPFETGCFSPQVKLWEAPAVWTIRNSASD
jgi:hypothetical protein